MTSGRRGERQTAYQILVASSLKLLGQEKGDLWDSGKVETNQSSQVEYAGQPLVSREDCFWKVRLWDGEGRAGGWSAAERWQIGLLKPGDWSAQWIWAGTPATAAIPYLRKSFDLKWPIKRAVLYTTALGLYEAHSALATTSWHPTGLTIANGCAIKPMTSAHCSREGTTQWAPCWLTAGSAATSATVAISSLATCFGIAC